MARRSNKKAAAAVIVALVAMSFTPAPASAGTATTARVSVASGGIESHGHATSPAISADGRYVTFASTAPDLVPDDTNATEDVFVHDRQSGATTRVNVASDGTQANGDAFGPNPDVSGDGRFVVFASIATNLVPGDTNDQQDIFVRDSQAATTTRISLAADGTQLDRRSDRPVISADGRFVAFQSSAATVVAGDTNEAEDVFVHDRQSGATTLVSAPFEAQVLPPIPTRPIGSGNAAISDDGRYVSFRSDNPNIVRDDTNRVSDVFVRDLQTNTTTRVSVNNDGTQRTIASQSPSISADGRYVAFTTREPGGGLQEIPSALHVWVHDRQTPSTTRASVSSFGNPAIADSDDPSISGDGRYVTFVSTADNLVNGDTNGTADVFRHDRQRAITTRESVATDGSQADRVSDAPSLSGTGGQLAFVSGATNLVSGDGNNAVDVFVRTMKVPLSVSVGDVTVVEGQVAAFTVTLSKPTTKYVTVNYATAKGTAIGADFTAKSGSLTFSPGTTSLRVKVLTTDDTIDEPNETFTLNLSGASNATIADALGLGTITDND